MSTPLLRAITTLGVGLLLATLARAAAPAGRYDIMTDTVLDRETGLTWQRTTGASTTWAGAGSTCVAAGWRLPRLQELQTLVDVSRADPTIDVGAFGDTLSVGYWAATADATDNTRAWGVDFSKGRSVTYPRGDSHSVRCVKP